MNLGSVLIAAALALSAPALAGGTATLSQIIEQQKAIASDIDAGKSNDLKAGQIDAIRKAQQKVFSLTDGKTEMKQLTPTERLALKNALEDIKAAWAGSFRAAEIEDVCWQEQTLGSRITKMRCATQEEARIAREGARGYTDRPHACALGACAQTHSPSQGPNQ